MSTTTASLLATESVNKLTLPEGMRLLTFGEKASNFIFGVCNHKWSRPFSVTGIAYPSQYNSHRVCMGCTRTQLFNSRDMVSGPEIHIDAKK